MGTAVFATTTSLISDVSSRAIIGASIALLLVLILSSTFKHNDKVKKVLFLIVVGIVLCTSSVLLTTAYFHINDTAPATYIEVSTR